MMSLIVRLTLLFLALLAVVLIIVVGAVQQQPLADINLQGLAHCNRPCWAGIEPGRTSIERVPPLVSARYSDRRFGLMRSTNAYAVNESGSWINIGGNQGVVVSVQLTMPLELWRLVLLYGSPTCMEPLESVTILYWVYSDSQIIANFIPVDDDWKSHTLVLQAGNADPCYQRDDRQPWRGWAAF